VDLFHGVPFFLGLTVTKGDFGYGLHEGFQFQEEREEVVTLTELETEDDAVG